MKADDGLLEVVPEFVSDVQAVGPKQVEQEWPDLYTTYQKAVLALRVDSRASRSALS